MFSMEIDVQVLDIVAQYISQFICIGIVILIIIRLISRKWQRSRPVGVWALSTLLMTAAVYDLLNFSEYEYNRVLFKQLSENLFQLRYYFSLCLRGLIIITAAGLLAFNELARKTIVALAVFTIATIYWKHPFYVFENIAVMVESNYFGEPVTELSFPTLPWISLFAYVTADIVFAGILIYYFTLTPIRGMYTKDETPA